MSFWTPQALGPLAQSESSGNPSLIHYPSGYTSSGVRSSASGLYGYLDSTWQTYAGQAGVDTSLYPRAYMAPASVQNQVALITPVSNWTCPGCNATASRLATDPSNVTGSPLATSGVPDNSSGGTPAGDPTGTSVTMNPTGTSSAVSAVNPDQPQSAPVKVTLQPGVAQSVQDWITSLETSTGAGLKSAITAMETAVGTYFGGVANWFVRGALILLGVTLVGVALVFLMWDHGGQQVAQQAGRIVAT